MLHFTCKVGKEENISTCLKCYHSLKMYYTLLKCELYYWWILKKLITNIFMTEPMILETHVENWVDPKNQILQHWLVGRNKS